MKKTVTKTAPSKVAPSKTAPSKEEPKMKKTVTKTAPSKVAPSKTAPSKEEPKMKKTVTKTAPSKVAPSKTAPSKVAPSKTAPSKTAPSKVAPSKTAPSKTAPALPPEIAALLAQYGVELPETAPQKAVAKDPVKKSEKADRSYTTDLSSADFTKGLFATPVTERGCEYYNERGDIIMAIRKGLAKNRDFSEILDDLENVEDLDGLIAFLTDWKVGRRASRVIIQLVSPVVCVCCTDTARLASECYGIARANALMGSCHNSYMVSKWSKGDALPFERTCCNFSTICSDVERAVELCTYWFYNLNK